MQPLDPLCIEDIGLAAWHILGVARIDQYNLEAALLQNLIDRHPVDSRRLHRHGGDPDLLEPLCKSIQIAGEAVESTDGFVIRISGDTDDMKGRADIDSRCMAMNDWESCEPLDFLCFVVVFAIKSSKE